MKMKFVQKEGHGALFLNEKKVEDKQPDYTGTITIEGKQRPISAWIKVSKSGAKYISVSVSEPFQKKEEKKPQEVRVDDFKSPTETTQEVFDEGYGEPQEDEEVPF